MKYLIPFTPLNESIDRSIKMTLFNFLENFFRVEYKNDGLILKNVDGEFGTVTLFGDIIMLFGEAIFFKEVIPIIEDWFKDVKWDILFPYTDKGQSWEIRFDGKNMRKFILEMNKLMDNEKFKQYIDAKKFGI